MEEICQRSSKGEPSKKCEGGTDEILIKTNLPNLVYYSLILPKIQNQDRYFITEESLLLCAETSDLNDEVELNRTSILNVMLMRT